MTDSVDSFLNLIKLDNAQLNKVIDQIFDLVYRNTIPKGITPHFTDNYLFCFFKDPKDPTKLRPIGIPSAMRRIIASHVAYTFRQRFAAHVWSYNWAADGKGGMYFVINSMQLATEMYIKLL